MRPLLKTPGLTAAAILSLAVGLGANTAMFGVASALLLRPLPYANANRLVILWNRSPGLNIAEDWFSTAQYFDIKAGHSGFEQLALAIGANYNLTGDGDPERIGAIRVSSNLLPMLGVRPSLGELFVPEDDAQGRAPTALLSHGTWIRRYGGEANIIGRSLVLNGTSYRVIGVLPPAFALPREVLPTLGVIDEAAILLPLPLPADAATIRTREDYNIIGTLKPGVSVEEAQAGMDAITARLRREHPDVYPPNGGLTFSIVPMIDQVVGGVRRPLAILVGAVALVLVIACANVGNLLLSRAMGRRKEIAVRVALGATPARILRLLLRESVQLSIAGGVLGVGLAYAAVDWMHAIQPKDVPRLTEITIDGWALLFAAVLSIAAGLIFGLAPALGLGRFDRVGALKDDGRGLTAGALWGRGGRLGRTLVIAEVALAIVLLVGAGLLIRSMAALQRVNPGFNATGVTSMELALVGPNYADGRAVLNASRDLWRQLDDSSPGAISGGITSLPLSGYFAWGPITVEGRVPPAGEKFLNADIRIAAGRYFEAMRIPIVRGRAFADTDTTDVPRVVIVDAFMSEQLWPGEDPVGRRIKFGDAQSTSPWLTVIGVAGRVRQYGLDTEGRIALYVPHTQSPSRSLYVVVRGADERAPSASAVTAAVRAVDPALPLMHVRPMADIVRRSLARPAFLTTLLTAFAGIALLLAAVGTYSVLAYVVGQSTREMGIRLAIGATPRDVVRLVVRHGLKLATAGAAIGLVGAAGLTRVMTALLFGVQSLDLASFAVSAMLIAVVAVAASYLPARRASRIDPLLALRRE